MQDTDERTVTESQHARGQEPVAICMSNWDEEEQEREVIQCIPVYCNAKNNINFVNNCNICHEGGALRGEKIN